VSSRSTTFATMPRTGAVPSTSLVCPSNCGSGNRTATTAVRPAVTSSFSTRSPPSLAEIFSRRAFRSTCLRMVRSNAASKPARWLPPLGVAMMLTKDRTSVSYPVPHRSATSTSHARSTSMGARWPRSSSAWTVSVKVSVPTRRHVSVTGWSGARKSTKSTSPPSWRKDSSTTPPSPGVPGSRRSSRTTSSSPGTRKDVCRARVRSSS